MGYKDVQYEAGKFRTGTGGAITDVEVDGVSVVNAQGVAEIPAIPDAVMANPQGTASTTLTKLQIGNDIYSVGGGSSSHSYSTAEQVVGTWVDGKPVYEQTVTLLNVNYSTIRSQYPILQIPSLETPVEIRGVFSNSAKTQYHTLPYMSTAQTPLVSFCDFDMSNKQVYFCSTDTWGSTNIFVTIRYTKTTD